MLTAVPIGAEIYAIAVGEGRPAGLVGAQSNGLSRAVRWTHPHLKPSARPMESLALGQVLVGGDAAAGLFAVERAAYRVVPAWSAPTRSLPDGSRTPPSCSPR